MSRENAPQEAPHRPFTMLSDLCMIPGGGLVRSRTDYWFRGFQRILEEAEFTNRVQLQDGTLYTFLVETINRIPSPGVYLYGILYLGAAQGWAGVSMALSTRQVIEIPFVAGRILETDAEQQHRFREVSVTNIVDISGATRQTRFAPPNPINPLHFIVTEDCKIRTDLTEH